MARTLEAILKANTSQHDSAIAASTAKIKAYGDAAQAAGAKADAGLSKGATATAAIGKSSSVNLGAASRGLALFGAGALVAFGGVVKSAANFDQAMSHVAATGADARGRLDELRKAALDLGASTQFSATEVAAAEEELAKAGVKTADVLSGGLKGALDLAAAGGLSVAESATIAGTALKQFELNGAQIPHVADLLAAGANAAVGSVSDLAAGLKYVGPVAHGMGISIDQTVGSLTAFAAAGLVGEQGGTALRGVLLSLTSPSKLAAKTMADLGINLYDAKGAFVGVDGAAQQLAQGLGTLSEADRNAALGRIFGNTQVTAANILYRGGAALIQDYTNQVNDQGAAAEQAAIRMDNLKGDVEKLGGALQTAFISAGSGVQSPFRTITEGLTGIVDGFNKAPDSVKTFGLSLLGLVGAGALAAAGVLKIVQAANAAKVALAALSISARAAGIATAGIAAGLVIGAIAFQKYAESSAAARQRTTDLTDALQQSGGVIDEYVASLRAKALEESGALKSAQELGISIEDVTQASLGNADAQARVNAALGLVDQGFRDSASSAKNSGEVFFAASERQNLAAENVRKAIGGGNKDLAEANAAYKRLATSQQSAIGSTQGLTAAQVAVNQAFTQVGVALDALSEPYARTAKDTQDLNTLLFASGQGAIAASNAHIGYLNQIKATDEATAHSTHTMDESTKQGRLNKTALNQLATSGQAYVQSLVQQGATAKEAAAATRDVRAAFISSAEGAGVSKRAARELADSYGLIPKKITTTFEAFGLALQQVKIEEFRTALQGLTEPQRLEIESIFNDKGAKAAQAKLAEFAKKSVTVPIGADGKKARKELDTIQRLKIKEKTARVNGDTKKAKSELSTIDRLKIKEKTAKVGADTKRAKSGLDTIQRINIKEKTVRVSPSGVGATQSAINGIHGKTVTIYTKHVSKGGQGTGGGIATGGYIRGPGTPTSDSIPAMLSDKEFVTNAAATAHYGVGFMAALNARAVPKSELPAFRDGGLVGAQRLAAGGIVNVGGTRVDITPILAMIAALNNPLGLVARSTRDVATATRGVAVAQAALRRAGAGNTAARDKLTKATDRLKTAEASLLTQRQALADNARQIASGLTSAAVTTSTDPLDVLNKRKESTAELVALNTKLLALRKAGLNDTDIQGITDRGALDGAELATAILKGGKGLVAALNLAQTRLAKAANSVGYTTAAGVIKRADGGWVDGSLGGKDQLRLLATRREFLVNDTEAPKWGGLLEAINSGRLSQSMQFVRGMQQYGAQGSHYSQPSRPQAPNVSIPVTIGNMGYNEAAVAYRIQGRVLDALNRSGLTGVTT